MPGYDYIVVGGGSAGMTAAARLSSAGARTLLVEAGRSRGGIMDRWMVEMPAGYPYAFSTTNFNWAYQGELEPSLNSRRIYQPRGKVLGGSSAINGMGFLRGHRLDYDRWDREGAPGWSFNDVLPYLKKLEDWQGPPSDYRGKGGPIKVICGDLDCPFYHAFLAAGLQAGYPSTDDVNGEQQEGFGHFQMNVDHGIRASTAHGYLRYVADLKFLSIVSLAHVTKILFAGDRAIGVEYQSLGELHQVHASREVILSGGTFNSPQILMLSGVGPEEELHKHGIEVRHNLSGVGQNLQDHPLVYAKYKSKKAVSPIKYERLDRKIMVGLEWMFRSTGPGTTNYMETIALIKSEPSLQQPDVEFQYYPLILDHDAGYVKGVHGWTNCVGPTHVEGRGWVKLRSSNPKDPPRIFSNLLSTDYDLNLMIRSLEMSRDVMNQAAYREFLDEELEPAPSVKSRTQIVEYLRNNTSGDYHPVGTCKMGTDSTAVVDPQLRVVGLTGLRVADASIMPSIVNANTNVTSIMIGERVADFVLSA